MRMLYVIFKYLTFVGSFIRGFWEHMTCQLLGLLVDEPGYLRANEMCGHVEFVLPKKNSAVYLSAIGPGVINFITGLPMLLVGLINLRVFGVTCADSKAVFIIYILLVYVGASLMCSLFPSYEVALHLWDKVKNHSKICEKILLGPASLTVLIGSWLERFGIPQIFWIAVITAAFLI